MHVRREDIGSEKAKKWQEMWVVSDISKMKRKIDGSLDAVVSKGRGRPKERRRK